MRARRAHNRTRETQETSRAAAGHDGTPLMAYDEVFNRRGRAVSSLASGSDNRPGVFT